MEKRRRDLRQQATTEVRPYLLLLVGERHGDVMLVECQTEDQRERLGRAAIWSDGGVSAWPVELDGAESYSDRLVELLKQGFQLHQVETYLSGQTPQEALETLRRVGAL